MNRRRNDVVARLSHVDVVVWMYQLARTDRFAGQLRATIGNHLIDICVRARAGAGLKNVEWKMFVQFTFGHFLRRLHDERRAVRVEQTEIMIGLGSAPLDQTKRPNERAAESITAYRKIQDGAVGGGAIKRMVRHGHLAHRIFFDARFFAFHRA